MDRGTWQRVHPGVFAAFNGPIDRLATLWSAILRVGSGATLSHETAAELDGFLDHPSARIHITAPAARRPRPVEGIMIHRSRRIDEARHPVRLPPRTRTEETVLDLVNAAKTLDQALSWIARACGRRLTTAQRLREALQRRNRNRWRAELLEGLTDVRLGAQSLLELRYLHNVERAHGLPTGERQHKAHRDSRTQWDDVLYEEYDTIVELDGRIGHVEEGRWRDMRRDNAIVTEGRSPLRYGWSDVSERYCQAAAQLAYNLQQRGWTGTPHPCGPSCTFVDDLARYSRSNRPRSRAA